MLPLLATLAMSQPAPAFDHVVMVSVDGLHAGVFASPIVDGLPAFSRLRRGPGTLEARTDADATITLPNHVSMLTSRPLSEHGWQWNDDPPAIRHGGTIHARAGKYIPSVFDAAHDRGVSTALFAGKTKFWLFEQSYGAGAGAKDATPPDDGRAKIDLVVFAKRGADLAAQCAARLSRAAAEKRRTLDFLHLAEPDVAGHAHEWDLTPGSKYLESVALVDRWL
ncbi:MAG: alkaline phosphatase family protein, partial [Phycisphaerae bacterium]|nr:alkaline phosphatase family protein [Phycisphaerae bacterium]